MVEVSIYTIEPCANDRLETKLKMENSSLDFICTINCHIKHTLMLKKTLIIFGIFYAFALGFYLWAVLPEYCACNEQTPYSENIYVKDFWGSEILCIGDQPEFNEWFHFWYLIFLSLFTLLLIFGGFFYFKRLNKLVK